MGNEGVAGDRDDGDARRHAFAVLQDKYVSARRLACCPTMDLVAVLTVDGQLVVHVSSSFICVVEALYVVTRRRCLLAFTVTLHVYVHT